MKTAVIYWSGTGNTEQMAQAIADAAGAELFAVSDFSGSQHLPEIIVFIFRMTIISYKSL